MAFNILITGSGGFIGSNLKKYLSDKYDLLTPRSYELDLCNKEAVLEYFLKNKIDFIIHCATNGGIRGIPDEETTLQNNISMVENLICAKEKDTRMILFGSGAMYGKDRDLHKIKESELGKYIPKDLYGLSKMKIAQKISEREDVLCLNIFACYGYNEKETRFPSYAIKQNIENKPIEINQNVVFDYLFSEDMCKIVEFFIKNKPQDKIINITPSKSVSLLYISDIINKISDYKCDIIIKRHGINFEYTGDNALLLKNYPDIEFTQIELGIKKLYNYIKSEKSGK